jgi:hypothetical protein
VATAVIAATSFEYQPLEERARSVGLDFSFHSFGIGAIASAQNAKELAAQLGHADVIYIGTCGTFVDFKEPNLICADVVSWSCLGERMQLAYKIKGIMPEIVLPPPLEWARALEKKTVLCAASISLDGSYAASEYHREDCVENVELYSIASVLASQVKSFTTVLASTNQVSTQSHEQWRANFAIAARMTSDYIIQAYKRN